MKKLVLVFALLQLCAAAQTATPPRPRILGIDHVSFYTTAPDGVKKLYGEVLGLSSADPVEPGGTLRYMVGTQWVGYSPAPDPKSTDRMDHVALRTDNIAAMRKYLIAQGINVPQIEGRAGHSLFFFVTDPEGHKIEFVERDPKAPIDLHGHGSDANVPWVSHHMIHAGFLVYHQGPEDHFYREILGFRPYWHGGMKDDVTEWLAMQVPDGTDWIEYMLHQPEHADLQLTGVMNHISLGVVDIKQAQATLESHGWKPHGDEKAQMGKDGKWQLNLYDPDLVRVELMEFKPVQKPCCSDFTGPHPSE
jgi:catechol 2,3-dioxygenase-like lactoylglutathione lyase family enzyme